MVLESTFLKATFSEIYCVGVIEMEKDWVANDNSPKRSRLAALLPTIITQVSGLMNGFALSSILSTVLIFLLVYVWGSARRDWCGHLFQRGFYG